MTKTKDDFKVTTWNSKPAKGSAGKTGLWRTYRPVINHELCTRCEICALYCPEPCIELDPNDKSHEKGKIVIDYEFCKGCGICANECARQCITMEKESDFFQEEEEGKAVKVTEKVDKKEKKK